MAMEAVKGNSHLWLKFKIVTPENEIIIHQIKVSNQIYKTIVRNVKIIALDSPSNDEINKEIFLELLAYSSTLSQIFLKYDTH